MTIASERGPRVMWPVTHGVGVVRRELKIKKSLFFFLPISQTKKIFLCGI